MIILLIIAPSSGFIMSRLGNVKPTLWKHNTYYWFFQPFYISFNATSGSNESCSYSSRYIIEQVGIFDITMKSTPKQFSGISLGMTVVLNILGSSIGPLLAIYKDKNQVFVKGIAG